MPKRKAPTVKNINRFPEPRPSAVFPTMYTVQVDQYLLAILQLIQRDKKFRGIIDKYFKTL